jgi:hypothetical protein
MRAFSLPLYVVSSPRRQPLRDQPPSAPGRLSSTLRWRRDHPWWRSLRRPRLPTDCERPKTCRGREIDTYIVIDASLFLIILEFGAVSLVIISAFDLLLIVDLQVKRLVYSTSVHMACILTSTGCSVFRFLLFGSDHGVSVHPK